MSITRRIFLRSTAAAGAIGAAGVEASQASTSVMSPREQALWHLRELEKLTIASGAASAFVMVGGRFCDDDAKERFPHFIVDHRGNLHEDEDLFREEPRCDQQDGGR